MQELKTQDLFSEDPDDVLPLLTHGPSFAHDDEKGSMQKPLDPIDEAMMESFPCSDPPSFSHTHA